MRDAWLRQAARVLAVAEAKLGEAIDLEANFSRTDVRAVVEAADALDEVGDLALADGRETQAAGWWELADRVRARLGRPISFLAR